SRGLDRDRVVDETGNQTVVFGRRGSRPFNLTEMEAFYRHFEEIYPTNFSARRSGELYQVEDVKLKAGKLETSSKRPLNPTEELKASYSQPEPRPPQNRLTRRGE